jgi:hypothetical protein
LVLAVRYRRRATTLYLALLLLLAVGRAALEVMLVERTVVLVGEDVADLEMRAVQVILHQYLRPKEITAGQDGV